MSAWNRVRSRVRLIFWNFPVTFHIQVPCWPTLMRCFNPLPSTSFWSQVSSCSSIVLKFSSLHPIWWGIHGTRICILTDESERKMMNRKNQLSSDSIRNSSVRSRVPPKTQLSGPKDKRTNVLLIELSILRWFIYAREKNLYCFSGRKHRSGVSLPGTSRKRPQSCR